MLLVAVLSTASSTASGYPEPSQLAFPRCPPPSHHKSAPVRHAYLPCLDPRVDFRVSDFGDMEQVTNLHLVGDATLAMGFCYDYTVFVNMDYTCLQLPLPQDPYHRTPPRESMKQVGIVLCS